MNNKDLQKALEEFKQVTDERF